MVVKAKNGHIVVEEKSETAKINTDKEKLTEVLMNLVDNALKYGNDGQTITITAFRVEKGNLRIEVSDQGQGISAKKVSRLFNKFSQLEPSLSRSQEGIGLGLYVCKLIVEKMGGQIGVESEEGKGTKFFLIFPVLSE
jgi:signal transduction histidine kinase